MRLAEHPLSELFESVPDARHRLSVMRKAYGSPRTTCFNVHGFRIAVNRITGEIRILQSVHAADAGTILNPMQCRGQIEGAVAQGIGSSLFERMVFDDHGKMINPTFRNYRISAFADIPRNEISLPTPTMPTARSARNPPARHRSFRLPRLSATLSPTPPASGSTACRSAPTASSRN
jgi:CO/xanthine dehydrogenase Mo-binding subunit